MGEVSQSDSGSTSHASLFCYSCRLSSPHVVEAHFLRDSLSLQNKIHALSLNALDFRRRLSDTLSDNQ